MKTVKTILILIFFGNSLSILAQDSLLKAELTFCPFYHQKKLNDFNNAYLQINKNSKGPSLLLDFPLSKKLSLSTGLNFHMSFMEVYYYDSIKSYYQNPTEQNLMPQSVSFVYKHKYYSLDIMMPILVNYKLLQYKNLNFYIAGGIETGLWNFYSNTTELYPVEKTHTISNSFYGFDSFLDFEVININAILKYYPMKHVGLLIKPFICYNLDFDEYSLTYGLGIGICYR